MSLFALCGIAVISAILCLLLRESGSKMSPFVAIAAGVILLSSAVLSLSGIMERLSVLSETAHLGDAMGTACKAVGLGYITEIGGGICRDLGESATAARLEICGKLSILLSGLPFLLSVFEEALSHVA